MRKNANPNSAVYCTTWPLGKLGSVSGVRTPTRSCDGRGRCTTCLSTVSISEATWVPSNHTASTHRPRTANGAATTSGITQLWGGKPGQLTTYINVANQGAVNCCSHSVAV